MTTEHIEIPPLTDAQYVLEIIDETFAMVPQIKAHHDRLRKIARDLDELAGLRAKPASEPVEVARMAEEVRTAAREHAEAVFGDAGADRCCETWDALDVSIRRLATMASRPASEAPAGQVTQLVMEIKMRALNAASLPRDPHPRTLQLKAHDEAVDRLAVLAAIPPSAEAPSDRAGRASQAVAPELVPAEIRKIIELLHTQDNRITDNPLFAVQHKHQVCGLDDGYEESWVWVNSDCEEISDEEEVASLNAAFDKGDDTPGYRRVGVAERWEFVTGCLTEQGCKDYIRANGHNLREPRIYAYGSYRNAEFIALRKWLMGLAAMLSAVPAPPSAAAPNEPHPNCPNAFVCAGRCSGSRCAEAMEPVAAAPQQGEQHE